ncbi:hypothetical protein NSMM_150107 [Nitrosomonas mobilis]|uniref:Uncharacterized protein n=1 Tax=Nitrosomonas mobilis TaxID=51642 RepID=A0A1G5SD65_9PROT|nr:hypothetical protein NSMM_150107 [Nitrosomonas mobilis]
MKLKLTLAHLESLLLRACDDHAPICFEAQATKMSTSSSFAKVQKPPG